MFSRRTFTTAGLALAGGIAGARVVANAAEDAPKRFEIMKTDEEWKKILTKEQYYVLREHGTERAGTSPLDKVYEPGVYNCAACDLPLYTSDTKFDSGTGWPSFWKPIDGAVGDSVDKSFFTTRTEIHCRRCGGHLGHVFEDGPAPTGLRYCMNGVSLKFVPKAASGT
ncbi:MAG: peptide-methionine (R)-S-oxide reductase [Hyphomicrobium sp.]|nr:MAG: peptide-methionine (R)-S-oxide reductase [Hyphomicrobium sp.]